MRLFASSTSLVAEIILTARNRQSVQFLTVIATCIIALTTVDLMFSQTSYLLNYLLLLILSTFVANVNKLFFQIEYFS